jgi:hypothetical protein
MNTTNRQGQKKNQPRQTRQQQGSQKRVANNNMHQDHLKHQEHELPETRLFR